MFKKRKQEYDVPSILCRYCSKVKNIECISKVKERYEIKNEKYEFEPKFKFFRDAYPYVFDRMDKEDTHGFLHDSGSASIYIDAICNTMIVLHYDADWVNNCFRPELERKFL